MHPVPPNDKARDLSLAVRNYATLLTEEHASIPKLAEQTKNLYQLAKAVTQATSSIQDRQVAADIETLLQTPYCLKNNNQVSILSASENYPKTDELEELVHSFWENRLALQRMQEELTLISSEIIPFPHNKL